LSGAIARGDGTSGAKVGEIVKDGSGSAARGNAAAGKKDVFNVGGVGGAACGIGFREGIAGKPAPVEFHDGPTGVIRIGTGFFSDANAVAVVDVAVGAGADLDEAIFGVQGINGCGKTRLSGVAEGVVGVAWTAHGLLAAILSGLREDCEAVMEL